MMLRASALARRGQGGVLPNPMVGAIVLDSTGRVAGLGWHRKAGGAHAEIEALDAAGDAARGGTLFVTLEPCNHTGRTPPCVERILKSGISRVVCAMRDPNPRVPGGGIEALQSAGIAVELGVAEAEAVELNQPWIRFITAKGPYAVLKLALSADGAVASPASSDRRWVTAAPARRQVHRLRGWCEAVLVGAGTVAADDPLLTNRSTRGRSPLRIIVDTGLRTDPHARVFNQDAPTMIVSGPAFDQAKAAEIKRRGAEHLVLPSTAEGVDLKALFLELRSRGIQGILCEPGPKLASQLLLDSLVDRLVIYRSPDVAGPSSLFFPEPILVKSAGRGKLIHSAPVGRDKVEIYDLSAGRD